MNVVQVTCFDITGHTRDELTALREQAKVPAGRAMNEDQKHAARLLLEAFAAFIAAQVAAPKDIRLVAAELVARYEELTAGNPDQGRMAA